MNLTKLFIMQKDLMEHINYKGRDKFDKTILALLVEVGECANEWRGFKYWSQNQQPNTKQKLHMYSVDYKNPLLEEYIDGLHLTMELGIEKGFGAKDLRITMVKKSGDTVGDLFVAVYQHILNFKEFDHTTNYQILFSNYIALGVALGFTWEQIEAAYVEKNTENHARQNAGY